MPSTPKPALTKPTAQETKWHRLRQWRVRQPQSFAQFCQRLDAEYQLPRPATAQQLPAYQAALALFSLAGQSVSLVLAGLLAGWLFVLAAQWLAYSLLLELGAHCLAIFTVLVALAEAAGLWLPYYQVQQRVTHGTARWADAPTLTGLRLALKQDMPLPPLTLMLGRLGSKHYAVLGPEHALCHLALFGPPGSGKSSTFFITWQRAWAQAGSVVVLDPKGELYDQTAYLFRQVYRLDLQSPERSDHWNFLPACKENAEYAHKVASLILDTEQSKRSSADPFWKEAEKAALTAILLELNQLHPRPAPLFFALGNHDGERDRSLNGTENNMTVWSATMRKRYLQNPQPDAFYSGNTKEQPFVGLLQDYYAWEWGDALFVVLDPFWFTKDRGNDDNWARTLGEEQYQWLRKTLAGSRAKFKFVFLHHLVGGIDRSARGGIAAARLYEWGGRNADGTDGFKQHRPGWEMPIHQLLVKHKTTAVFHGHDHLFAKEELDGIVYQEVPQPGHPRYDSPRNAAEYGYTSGEIQGSAGHLRISVSAKQALVEYVRVYLPKDEQGNRRNKTVSYSYAFPTEQSQ